MESKKIFLKEKGVINCVEVNNIIHIQCDSYLSTVYTSENKMITVSKSLKQLEEELSGLGFIRINHHTIINSQYLAMIKRGDKRNITLSNNIEFTISRRKMYLIKELLQK